MPDSTAQPAPDAKPAKPPLRRCRSLTVRGRQCTASALRGQQFCVAHARYRLPVCPQGPKVAIPLLEDLDTIQVVATQVAHGLFTEILDPWRAGKILYALQVAALTLPRPAPLKPADAKPIINEPVPQPESDLDGQFLGPDVLWDGNPAAFNPVWSDDKRRYEEECRRLAKPKPVVPEDFPVEGWLTLEERDSLTGLDLDYHYDKKILALRIEADQRGELPPIEERVCSYRSFSGCNGPAYEGYCHFCKDERFAHADLRRRQGNPALPAPLKFEREQLSTGLNAAQPAIVPQSGTSSPDVKLDNTANAMIPNPAPRDTTQGGPTP